MHTPPLLRAAESAQLRHAEVAIDEKGHLSVSMETTFSGNQYANHLAISNKSTPYRDRMLKSVYNFNLVKIADVTYSKENKDGPILSEKLRWAIPTYFVMDKGRASFLLNFFNRSEGLPKTNARFSPLHLDREYMDVDSIVYSLPLNLSVERVPSSLVIESELGRYSMNITVEGKKIRKFFLRQGRFDPELYQVFSSFINKIYETDRTTLTILE